MTTPIDYQSRSTQRRSSRLPKILVMLAALIALGLPLLRPLLGFFMATALQGTSKSMASGDTARLVAVCLMHWGVFGTVPNRNPDYANLQNSIAGRMTGINGFTESDGFHGDGTDWCEVELSPDLAAELRTTLVQSTTVKRTSYFPHERSAPSWWPMTWPAGAQCYEKDLQYLVLTATGTRAWFLRVRT